jgi:1-acyl-sn-glycerol-3-phosphate acyltransferase
VAGILSAICRSVVRGLVRIYYPRIEFTDRNRIPVSGPVLIVANHASSLMDPVVLGRNGCGICGGSFARRRWNQRGEVTLTT